MSVVQDVVGKMLASLYKICEEYGISNPDFKDSMKQTKKMLKGLNFPDQDYIDECCNAIDLEIDRHNTETQVSLTDDEIKSLKNILDHARDGTMLTTDKPVTKEELDSLNKNINSIKKKLS